MKKARGGESEVSLGKDILGLMGGETCVEVCLYCTCTYKKLL